MKGPIQSVEASCLVHETEDLEKVASKFAELLSTTSKPEVATTDGHFGNIIRVARFHLTGGDAEKAIAGLSLRLNRRTREEVVGSLPSSIDEHHALFLRFDKQALMRGEFSLGTVDPVRVKVKPRAFATGRDPIGFYSRLFGG